MGNTLSNLTSIPPPQWIGTLQNIGSTRALRWMSRLLELPLSMPCARSMFPNGDAELSDIYRGHMLKVHMLCYEDNAISYLW
jgi:hypothetical protein